MRAKVGSKKVVARPITLTLRTSRKGAEILGLEIRQLADRLGLPPTAVRIRRTDAGRAPGVSAR